MKKLVILVLSVIILGIIVSCGTSPRTLTEAERTISYETPYAISDDQAYRLSKLWIAENFNSAKDVITYEDPELGVITGRFNTSVMIAIRPTTAWMNFKIVIKENIANLSFSNVTIGDYAMFNEAQRAGVKSSTDKMYNSFTKVFQ